MVTELPEAVVRGVTLVTLGLGVGVALGVALGVTVGVAVGVAVGLVVGVAVGVALGVTVGVAVGLAVRVGVGVPAGSPVMICTTPSLMALAQKIAVAIEFHCYHLPVSQWRILRRAMSPGCAIEGADAAGVWPRAALIACDRDKSIA